jgi:ribose-phosphate pyrophosphokinase
MIRAMEEFETERRSQGSDPKLSNLILVPGPGDAVLARQVAAQLGVSVSPVRVHEFPDGEFKAVAAENVRKKDVYVVMSTSAPVSDNILALEQITSLLNRANAGTITAVVPYFGFARQDRRDKGRREPISARMVADHLKECGVNKVITVDIHAAQEEGFFNRLDALYGSSVLVPWVRQHIDPAQSVMLAPDSGSVKGAEAYAELLGIERDPVMINKRRVGDSEVKMSRLGGKVRGLTVIIRDDMISTGGTIAEAAKLAKDNGANKVIVVATHAVMAANAYERLMAAPIDKIFVTDSIPSPAIPASDRYLIVPIAPLIAEAIRRDELGESVSGLLTHLFPLDELDVPHLAFNPMTSFS